MKVALVFDWLTGLRGGERCLQEFMKLYPNADIFTLFHKPGTTTEQIDSKVKAHSLLQNIPGATSYYRALLPLFPFATSSFDFKEYDLVISLSHAAAKNIKVYAPTIHISYCFTPMRYIWDQTHNYWGKLTPLLWPLVQALRRWDKKGSDGVDKFVAISNFVSARIRCYYRRSSTVINPPVDTSWIKPALPGTPGVAFLYAGALVPYKKVDLIVRAFNELGLELWIVGDGPQRKELQKMAKNNICFFGRVSDAELADFYSRCKALIFPGTEDFGLVPVECLAAGRPVIGIDHGGAKEIIAGVRYWNLGRSKSLDNSQLSGVFLNRRAKDPVKEIVNGIKFFINNEDKFTVEACCERAKQFSSELFRERWSNFCEINGLVASTTKNVDFEKANYIRTMINA